MTPLRILLLLALLLSPFGVSGGQGTAYPGSSDQALQLWDSADTRGLVATSTVRLESGRLPRKSADASAILSLGQRAATIRYHAVAAVTEPGKPVPHWRSAWAPRAPPASPGYLIS
ncbi:hypothetical protein [Marinobacterium rhizophilum]|uniref:Uncharacterized protein n=1 Tax=Marinobacterium rhizophilum TaxID=420402 RepID=A0ABY5HMW7_9GAMM|nr:hypothetical protein [Marinobacterium rhizophilum]UTW12560.1 hypothetical protein KDW95_02425 [Marinobacterium rhizophilum]